MEEFPKISDSEWLVMKVLWKDSPLTASEIIAALKHNTNWSPKTIHTLINRLVKKEAIGIRKEDSSFYQYYPLVSEVESVRVETKSFIQKVYNGSLQLLIANFLKEEKLTPDEILELQHILNDRKE